MAFTVKTEAEKIFTNIMGDGAVRLAADSGSKTNFHDIFGTSNKSEGVKRQRAGSQLLFLTSLYSNASSATVRGQILTRIHRILINYKSFINPADPSEEGPESPILALGAYAALALAKDANMASYTQADSSRPVTQAELRSALTGYVSKSYTTFTGLNSYKNVRLANGNGVTVSTGALVGTKHAKTALNGVTLGLGAVHFINAAINGAGNAIYSDLSDWFTKMCTCLNQSYGNSRDNNGLTELCVNIGAGRAGDNGKGSDLDQIRGYFPSSGYNSFVIWGLNLAARAYRIAELGDTTKIPQFKNAVALSSHVCQQTAAKMMNYYNTQIINEGRSFEIGLPNFKAGSPDATQAGSSAPTSGYALAAYQHFTSVQLPSTSTQIEVSNKQFNTLVEHNGDPAAVTAYLYTTAWYGGHTLVTSGKLTSAIANKAGSAALPYDIVSTNTGVKAEAGASRILQGLAGAMNSGITTL
ncbi:calcium-binding protein [Lysinibacillus xylanilyticus]|uniref:calcium-binding protein n=1 Tax=Lysinibacillus xylanilyticus TaxID=582475 RepID=UPI003D0862DD